VRREELVIAPESFPSPGPQSIVLAALDEFDRIYGVGGRGGHDLGASDFDAPGAYLVARLDGHLAGGVGLRPIGEPALRAGEVKRLWVRPDLRRHGVATHLMDEVVQLAVTRDFEWLYLETGPSQPGAKRLYEVLAWEPDATYPAGAHHHDTGFRFRRRLR
jgi:GNAT superfamily N-acetyltransferase